MVEVGSEEVARDPEVRCVPAAEFVAHSNQGSQYTATRFENPVAKHGAQQSMSRRSNCYDNAHGGSFPGLVKVKLEISHYITYHNNKRRHSALRYNKKAGSDKVACVLFV